MGTGLLKLQLALEFNAKARERLYRKLAQLLRNGVSLDRALEQIAYIESKRRHVGIAAVLRRWRSAIQNGQNFGQCVAPFVPNSESLLLESGGNSGRLIESFLNAADAVAQSRRIKGAIIGAGSYPALLICVLAAALVAASYKIIPAFGEVLPVEQWQGAAALTADLTAGIRNHGLNILLFIIGTFFAVAFSLPRWCGRTRLLVEGIAPWSIYRMWTGSSFLLALAALMSSGVKIDDMALRRLSGRASPYLRERITAITKQLASGLNLGEAMARAGHNFPEGELIDDLRIYATLKGFEDNLATITREWVGEVEGKVVASMKILNTVVLMLIAVTMGLLISSIFGITQQIQEMASVNPT
jgi:type II secretory pathway component PulF